MKLPSKKYLYVLIAIVWFSSFHSILIAGQLMLKGKRDGYNISMATKSFEEIISNKDHDYLLLGPTEIWPFIKQDKNVLIIDIRNGKQFKKVESIIDSVDYIVINEDYKAWKFEEAFLKYFPNYYLDTELNISGRDVLLKISKLRTRVEGHKVEPNQTQRNDLRL